MNRKGFTLIELLAVVAVIGVLAAILLPALARAREQARRASCMHNLNQIGLVFNMYADENSGRLPWSGGKNDATRLVDLKGDYYNDVRIFFCPSDSNSGFFRQENVEKLVFDSRLDSRYGVRSSYEYFGAYTEQPISLPPPQYPIPRVPVMWDMFGKLVPNTSHVPGGGNVLWLDGSVEFILSPDWAGANLPYSPQHIAFQEPETSTPSTQDHQSY